MPLLAETMLCSTAFLWTISSFLIIFFQLSFEHMLTCFNGSKATNKNTPKYITDAEVNISRNGWIREADPELSSGSSQSLDYFSPAHAVLAQDLLAVTMYFISHPFFFLHLTVFFSELVTIVVSSLNPAKCAKQCKVVALKKANLCSASILTRAFFWILSLETLWNPSSLY